MEERLQKIIARAGITSRRRAEDLIRAGQVTVNGKVIKELGTRANALRDHIKVAGRLLREVPEAVYLILNKPSGCVSALTDPDGRPTVKAHLHAVPGRVFPVGVLDYHAQGLLLLTNDGELTNRLMRESSRFSQIYWLKVKGRLTSAVAAKVEQSTKLRLRLVRPGENPWYEARFAGGQQRSTADALAELQSALVEQGHPIEKQRRVAYGPLEIGSLQTGEFRFLDEREVKQLQDAAGLEYKGPAHEDENQRTSGQGAGKPRGKGKPRRSASDSRSGRYAGGRRR